MNYFTHQADMPPDAPSYVPRAADEDIFQAIRRGEFCYLLTPSQMGKSSLMIRTKARLEKEGCSVSAFSLESIGCASVQNPTQLYLGMLDKIGAYLEIEDELGQFWDEQPHLSPPQRFIKALDYAARHHTKRIAGSAPGNLVVMIDEIGLVRRLNFPTSDLFGAIREVHSHPGGNGSAAPLTFCLLGTATPSELVDDPAATPFRLGRRIDLRDFTLAEAMELARGLTQLGIDRPTAETVLRRVHYWTNGHPRLTQRLCAQLAEAWLRRRADSTTSPAPLPSPESWVDAVCKDLLFAGNPLENDDSLACVHDRLILRAGSQLPDLLDLYRKIRAGRRVPDDKHDPLVSQLLLSGIVRSEKGCLVTRNRIYRRTFDKEWIRSNMPKAELRREREAWRRGVAVTTGLGCIVAAAIALLLSLLVVQVQREREASAAAQLALAQLTRMAVKSGGFASEPDLSGPGRDPMASRPRATALRALSNAVPHYSRPHDMPYAIDLASEVAACLALPDLEPIPSPPAGSPSLTSLLSDPRTGALPSLNHEATGTGSPTNGIVRQWRSPDGNHHADQIETAAGPILRIRHQQSDTPNLLQLADRFPESGLAFRSDSSQMALILPGHGILVHALSETNTSLLAVLPAADGMRRPNRLQYQPGGTWLAEAAAGSGEVRFWNPDSPDPVPIRKIYPAEVLDIAWHPSGQAFAAITARQLILDLAPPDPTQDSLMVIDTDLKEPAGMTFNHRGDMLACLDGGNRRVLLCLPWAGLRLSFPLDGESFEFLVFSDDDKRLDAVCARTGRCQSWKVIGDDYYALPSLSAPSQPELEHMDFDDTGGLLVVGGNSELDLIDMALPSWAGRLRVPMAASAFFLPGSPVLLLGTRDSGFRWVTPTNGLHPRDIQWSDLPPIPSAETDPTSISAAAPLPGHRTLLALPTNCLVFNWNTVGREREFPTDTHYDRLATSPDGRWFAARPAGTRDLDLWNLSSPRREQQLQGAGAHFAFTPDNSWLIYSTEGQLRALSLEPVVHPPVGHVLAGTAGSTAPFALGGPNDLVALAGSGTKVTLYRFAPGNRPSLQKVLVLESPAPSPLSRLLFSPNQRQLVALDRERTVHTWNLDRIEQQLDSFGLQVDLVRNPSSPTRSD